MQPGCRQPLVAVALQQQVGSPVRHGQLSQWVFCHRSQTRLSVERFVRVCFVAPTSALVPGPRPCPAAAAWPCDMAATTVMARKVQWFKSWTCATIMQAAGGE
jgi:hypothetical protein